jgi:hypothetical protein
VTRIVYTLVFREYIAVLIIHASISQQRTHHLYNLKIQPILQRREFSPHPTTLYFYRPSAGQITLRNQPRNMQLLTLLTTVLSAVLSFCAIVSAQDNSSDASGAYTLTDDFTYDRFFEAFDFYTGPDPTQGFVNFQNLTSAIDQGLVGYLEDTESVFMGVDYKTKDPQGRAAVRLESSKSWNQGLMIADIHHAPASTCGVWPAMWLLGSNGTTGKMDSWPFFGEVDLMEGVNDYEHNAVTLHTTKGCTIDNTTQLAAGSDDANTSPAFTGLMATSDCDVKAANQANNKGCSIEAPETLSDVQMGTGDSSEEIALASYGTAFNAAGGGVYAMEWTGTYISVWFIPRDSPLYTEHFSGDSTASPDPYKWGTPIAHFAGKGCDYVERFKNLKLIFNITFCGEWAGDEKEWGKSCAAKTGVATCKEYVRDNPEVFKEAYWEVAGVKWYAKDQAAAKRDTESAAFVRGANGRFQRG